MRYIKPPDFKSVKELQAHYEKVEKDITTLLTMDASARTAAELNKQLQVALTAAFSYLSKVNKSFVQDELAVAFAEGKESVRAPQKLTEKEVATMLEKQGYKYAKNGLSHDTYVELYQATQSAGFGLKKRVNKIIEGLHETGDDSVYNVQQAILKDLQRNGILTVEYSNGAKQTLHAYAAMAARSARIESANIGAIGRALQAGTDLVKMTIMPQCCKLCGAYQGKVYSISGEDKRFPALFKTVLRSGYALPHPNCRHEFIPYFEEIESPEDVQKSIRDSKIEYDKNGDLIDVRFQKDIKAYAAWQAGNRQLNHEALEFQKMQAHYGEDSPYKTLGAFRRARRSDNLSPTFKKWRYRNADKNQYERWKEIIGEEEMPKTLDDFQEIKYNKDTKEKYAHLEKIFQGYSAYKNDNPDCTPNDYRTALKIKEQGVKGKIRIPPNSIDTASYEYDDKHINQERKHSVERSEAESYIQNAVVAVVKWNGKVIQYFSSEGATYVNLETRKIVTSFKKDEFDDNVKKMLVEVLKNGKRE